MQFYLSHRRTGRNTYIMCMHKVEIVFTKQSEKWQHRLRRRLPGSASGGRLAPAGSRVYKRVDPQSSSGQEKARAPVSAGGRSWHRVGAWKAPHFSSRGPPQPLLLALDTQILAWTFSAKDSGFHSYLHSDVGWITVNIVSVPLAPGLNATVLLRAINL